MALRDIDYVLEKLDWMRGERIWPNGRRYLWTDAFGLVLYVSLYRETGDRQWLDSAKSLVADVDQVLGRPRGYRIGEAPDRDGQYFHYLAMWLYARSQDEAAAPTLALVVALAMMGSCTISGVSGAIVPMILRRVGADPATASSIFLTTATDVASMGMFLSLARWLVL